MRRSRSPIKPRVRPSPGPPATTAITPSRCSNPVCTRSKPAPKGSAPPWRKDLTLQIQQVAQQDFKLQVGGIQQQVTVEAGAPLLNTESTEVGNVITQT